MTRVGAGGRTDASSQSAAEQLTDAEVARVASEVMALDVTMVRDLAPLVANLRALARSVDLAMRNGDGVATSTDAVER